MVALRTDALPDDGRGPAPRNFQSADGRRLAELEDLLAGVAQELRNPVSTVAFNLAILRQLEDPTGADIEVAAEAATEALERIERLVTLLEAAAQLSREDAS